MKSKHRVRGSLIDHLLIVDIVLMMTLCEHPGCYYFKKRNTI